jgi:hypothetical protein
LAASFIRHPFANHLIKLTDRIRIALCLEGVGIRTAAPDRR